MTRLLDDPATLQAATDDPTGFVEHDGLMIIDEIQLAPELLRPVKVDHRTLAVLPGRDQLGPRPLRRRRLRVGGGVCAALTPRRTAFFDSYLSSLIEHDVMELAGIERRADLAKLAVLAARAGGLLVAATVAGRSAIPRTTLVRCLELLDAGLRAR